MNFSAWTRFASSLVGELVAPTCCAACDQRVRHDVLFCRACASTVVRAQSTSHERAAFVYGGAIATAIARFKYQDRSDLASRLGAAMGPSLLELVGKVDAVVPVPLHSRRRIERGYDQAALLALAASRKLGVPLHERALLRKRSTVPQASLNRAARAVNVVDAFVASRPSKLEHRRVLLVDDVRTTGSTLQAATRALEEVKVGEVITQVLARRELADENCDG